MLSPLTMPALLASKAIAAGCAAGAGASPEALKAAARRTGGLADAVVDLVETGTTMRAAGLCVLKNILTSEAVLISNPQCRHPALVKRLVDRIQGYIDATRHVLAGLVYNAPRRVARGTTPLAHPAGLTPCTGT